MQIKCGWADAEYGIFLYLCITMKRLLALALLLITFSPAFGQIKQLYGEARLGFGATEDGGQFTGRLLAEYVNLVLDGNIGPNLSFYWKQRFTKPLYNPDIPLNATDQLWLRWDFSSHWAVQGGKIPVVVGGYEYDDSPIDLYYWSVFADRMPDVYALGANLYSIINPDQTLIFQFTQSPLGFGYNDLYHAALIWYGKIAPWWNTIWSVNWMDDPSHSGWVTAALGNRLEFGNFGVEADAMYRAGLARQYFPADYSAVLKLEYKFPAVTLFAKGSYDLNKDYPEDIVPVNSRFLTGGAGVEFFPLKNDDIRLHAVYWLNSDAALSNFGHNFNFGVTYRLRVVK